MVRNIYFGSDSVLYICISEFGPSNISGIPENSENDSVWGLIHFVHCTCMYCTVDVCNAYARYYLHRITAMNLQMTVTGLEFSVQKFSEARSAVNRRIFRVWCVVLQT